MRKVSFYCCEDTQLLKTVCTLAEKSYHTKLSAVILMPDLEMQETLNKALWTYSQKQFIPHGSSCDPLPEKQPIYITCDLEAPNNAELLMVVAAEGNDLNIKATEQWQQFKRVIVVHDSSIDQSALLHLRSALQNQYQIEAYRQNSKGGWDSES